MHGETSDELVGREPFDMFAVVVGRGIAIGNLLVFSVVVESGE